MVFNGSMVALEASGVRFESYYSDQREFSTPFRNLERSLLV